MPLIVVWHTFNPKSVLRIESHVLPPEVEEVFRRVQDSAHYMPDWQMEVRDPWLCSIRGLIDEMA